MHTTGVPVDLGLMFDQPLFDQLDESSVAEIVRDGWVVEMKRGDRLIARGDLLDGLYLVIEGRLKLYMLSCSGDERVLRVLQDGDTFGEAIMFNAFPSPVFVDALAPAKLAFFPRDTITRALSSKPDFTSTMLRSMSALMRNLIQDLETCCMQNAMQRTVNYLLRESADTPPPHVELTLPAAKAVVASTLNMSAETFSRELHRLQESGHIEINRRTIYLRNRDGLHALADGNRPAGVATGN